MGLSQQIGASSLIKPGVIDNAAARPASPFEGQVIYERDTDHMLVYNGDAWVALGSAATTANGEGGSSNIYSTSLTTTSALIVSASRRVQGETYVFTNLTFNMPTNANTDTSDWTAPANSSTYKWSYVYIRPTDNKFFLSNNAPAAGINYRTIGGSVCVYLFPAYTSTIYLYAFQLSNDYYRIEQFSATATLGLSASGITLINSTSALSSTTATTNVTTLFPSTATFAVTGFRHSRNGRLDAGGFSSFSSFVQIQDRSSVFKDIFYTEGFEYLKTPTTGGAYFPVLRSIPAELVTSTKVFDFTKTRIGWVYADGTADGYSGASWWLKGFYDGNIF